MVEVQSCANEFVSWASLLGRLVTSVCDGGITPCFPRRLAQDHNGVCTCMHMCVSACARANVVWVLVCEHKGDGFSLYAESLRGFHSVMQRLWVMGPLRLTFSALNAVVEYVGDQVDHGTQ